MTIVPLQRARARTGFSLIEVVVAMTLLIFVIGALSVLATRTSERARRTEILAKRNYVLVQQLNRYSGLPFDTLKARINNNPSIEDTIHGQGLNFLRRDTVVYWPAPGQSDTAVSRVRVTIIPLTTIAKDPLLMDSVVLHRRNPTVILPLFTP